jgi:NAD(P)-dependent dehydrogenase (short-subunit alcohol dehydrogenase family)
MKTMTATVDAPNDETPMSKDLRFDGKAAIITGTRTGLGKAHAQFLAERGADLVINARGDQQELFDALRAGGARVVSVPGDVGDTQTADRLVAAAIEAFGRIDIVINNAGIFPNGSIEAPLEIFEDQLRINVGGHYYVTRAAWPVMRKQGYGRVIMSSSTAGMYGLPELSQYGLTKAALYGLTRCLALEGAPYGIKVNAIAPDATSNDLDFYFEPGTELVDDAWAEARDYAWRKASTTKMVAIATALLAHEECPATGEIFAMGAGRVSQMFVGDPPGFYDPKLTPESLLENWARVTERNGYAVPRECIRDGVRWAKENSPGYAQAADSAELSSS